MAKQLRRSPLGICADPVAAMRLTRKGNVDLIRRTWHRPAVMLSVQSWQAEVGLNPLMHFADWRLHGALRNHVRAGNSSAKLSSCPSGSVT
jgi:hypothetical protein